MPRCRDRKPSWRRDDDFIPRVECRGEHVINDLFPARGNHDFLSLVVEAEIAVQPCRNSLAQGGRARNIGITCFASRNRVEGGLFDVFRRLEIRLTGGEADNVPPRFFQARAFCEMAIVWLGEIRLSRAAIRDISSSGWLSGQLLHFLKNGGTHFLGANALHTFGHDIGCTQAARQHVRDSFLDESRLFLTLERIAQQHGEREDLCQRVGDALPGNIGREPWIGS